MHHSVLLQEAIDGLNIIPGGKYIDATAGEGGHLGGIAERGGNVLGIDWDDSQKLNNNIVRGNFAEIEKIARENNFFPVDGILFDLGLSMHQIKSSERGFSYQNADEPLDMRINLGIKVKASDIVNSCREDELYELIAGYSEDVNSRTISRAIVNGRRFKRIEKVGDLLNIIVKTLGNRDKKTFARVFQSLRIAVNNEPDNLKLGLSGALSILKTGGRISIISFHSLEDRLIKKFGQINGLIQVNKKVIRGNSSIIYERSAKLRIFEKQK